MWSFPIAHIIDKLDKIECGEKTHVIASSKLIQSGSTIPLHMWFTNALFKYFQYKIPKPLFLENTIQNIQISLMMCTIWYMWYLENPKTLQGLSDHTVASSLREFHARYEYLLSYQFWVEQQKLFSMKHHMKEYDRCQSLNKKVGGKIGRNNGWWIWP